MRSERGRKPYSRPEPRSRASSDGMWLHDKAPTAPRADKKSAELNSNLNSKLIVSNLHYEITPKDLTAIFGQIGTLVREPIIRYDRSGRSIGVAAIFFETPAEATRAKKQFDGILAKGLPMSVAFDTAPPPAVKNARRTTSDSLLNRIQKPPLAERLSKDDSQTQTKIAPAAPRRGAGPIRTRGAKRVPKKPQTVEDLDKELDAFMGDEKATAAEPAGADVDMA